LDFGKYKSVAKGRKLSREIEEGTKKLWRKKWCESRHMRLALLKQADVSKGRAVLTSEFLISNSRHTFFWVIPRRLNLMFRNVGA